MARRGKESSRITEKRLDLKESKAMIRGRVLMRLGPVAIIALAAYGVAFEIAGETTEVNLGLAATVSIAVPAGLLKIWMDRRQKRLQRERITELEIENRRLVGETGELRGQLTEARRRTREVR